jgi:hypothetical protein
VSGKVSQATLLVELARRKEGLELFHTPAQESYALIPHGDHREVWPLRSTIFRRWLSRQFFAEAGTTPNSQALHDALNVIEGKALFEGAEHYVYLRLAEQEGAIWLDLANEYWQAAKITADGWEIVQHPTVRFRRSSGMLPLPYPVTGGSLDELRVRVNVVDADWPLFVGWLVGTLRPRGPYAILIVNGEQGSAKSTMVRVARTLVDPDEAPVRREPRDGQDLIVAARNGLIVAFDNVSRLSLELSDDLARLATGIGFGTRQLYTDLDEIVVSVARPIAINGIEEVATRGDLLDRGLALTLPRIDRYTDEQKFWTSFDAAHPRILGALLDATATAYARFEATPTPNVRMADFARWVTAAEPALGFKPGTFLSAYRGNRAKAVNVVLEASLIAIPIQTIADTGFDGTATELLEQLETLVDQTVRKKKAWPPAPHVLSGQLRRIAPALRRVGVEVSFTHSGARGIQVRKVDEGRELASTACTNVQLDALDSDFGPHLSASRGPRTGGTRLSADPCGTTRTLAGSSSKRTRHEPAASGAS